VEATFAELAAEPEAVEEPEAEAGVVAADSFSTPAVRTTGTPARSLPEKLVVVTMFVFLVVTPGTSMSTLAVTVQTAKDVPLMSQVSDAVSSTPIVSVT